MRIALIAPPWFTVPPSGYGGIEWVVSHLAEGLAERGHEVTLFASAGSRTGARLAVTYDEPPTRMLGDPAVEAGHLIDAYSRWREFDVIHDHTTLGLVGAAGVDGPVVVHTVHGLVTEALATLYARASGRVHLVCISGDQRSRIPPACDTTVIHNGIKVDDFPFSAVPGDYLLFVGRMSPDKGIVDAIELARRSGRRLVVLAKVNEDAEHAYFQEVVRPAMEGVNVDLLLETPPEVKAECYRGAYATLFPIHWPEPFGLVMAESMAAGTPVLAYRNGSVPEVIDDGVTGIICASFDEALASLPRIDELDRRACREHARRAFDASVNVQRHEALYERLLQRKASPLETGALAAGGGQGG